MCAEARGGAPFPTKPVSRELRFPRAHGDCVSPPPGGLRHKGERGPGGATRSPAALVGARGFVAVLVLPMFPPAAFRAAHVLFSLVFMFAFRMF